MAAGTTPELVLGDRPDDLVDERGRRERPVEDQGPALHRGHLERLVLRRDERRGHVVARPPLDPFPRHGLGHI